MKGMEDIELVIKIPEKIYESVMDGTYCGTLYQELKNGTPLPKGHGRLIDADEFISSLEDASKRNKYKELLIDDCLTVDDVFKAVIKSLQNRGLTKYDAPTIKEADKKERPDNICTQRCCLKNHNIGIIECDEECSNRTSF